MGQEQISLVVPCYNEEATIIHFYEEVLKVEAELSQYSFEMLFVDDGSKDRTLEILKELSQRDERVKWVSFSRNFGKEAAICAGFTYVSGDYVAIMDADLQDPPSLLPEMMDAIQDGYDCVATRRENRKGESPIRSLFAKMFYRIMNKISQIDIVDGARDFRLMRYEVVEAILQMSEYNRFTKGIYGWVGFKTKWIAYENIERVAGETKWSFWKLFLYSLEGIMAFSIMPLALASVLGVIFFLIAMIAIVVIVLRTLIWGDPVPGWPALASIIIFVGGIQLFCTGVIGQYLAKTYMETKRRPIFLVREKNV